MGPPDRPTLYVGAVTNGVKLLLKLDHNVEKKTDYICVLVVSQKNNREKIENFFIRGNHFQERKQDLHG